MGFPVGSVIKKPPANSGDAVDVGSIPGWGRSPRWGNGNPLQSSCLGNPMDRGAWRATVHGVSKSQTLLSNWACVRVRAHTHTHTHTHTTYVSAWRPRQDKGFGIHFQSSDLIFLLQISLSKSMLCSFLQSSLSPIWSLSDSPTTFWLSPFPISLNNVSHTCLSSPPSLSLDPFSLPPGLVQPPVFCPHSLPGPCPSLYSGQIPLSKPHCSPDAKVPIISKAISKDFSSALNDSSSLFHHCIPLLI